MLTQIKEAGLHWVIVTGMFQRKVKGKRIPKWSVWIFRLMAFVFAGYGAVCFVKADIISYMFLKSQFVFFDFEKSAILVFFENLVMMAMWIFITYTGGIVARWQFSLLSKNMT